MKNKTLIILIAALVIIYFAYKYGIKTKDNSEAQKRYIHEQEGTYNWLLNQYSSLFQAPPTTSASENAQDISVVSLIAPNFAKDKGHDWALTILRYAITHKISYKESIQINLAYMRQQKFNYEILNNFPSYEGPLK